MGEDARGELGRAAFLSISFLSLFLEVLLIRWCGAEIRILAYLRNLTLLGCFLGLGLGYAASSRRRLGLGFTFATVALLVGLAPYFKGLSSLLNFADLMSWLKGSKDDAVHFILGLLLLCGLYALLAFSFVPLGQALGAHFASVPSERRIREYTWNVLASLAGVAAFGALSFVSAPPLDWFAIATLAALLGSRTNKERASVFLLGALAIFFLIQGEKTPHLEGDVWNLAGGPVEVVETRWSPYQKIQLVKEPHEFERPVQVKDGPPKLAWDDYSAYVNGHWYSRVGTTDLVAARQRALYSGSPAPFDFEYARQIPYWVAPRHEKVLLLGAGMGRDAATALGQGAREIDVVEIESRFVDWGEEHHPAHPYSDKEGRVRIHVDDARRFLKSAPPGSYDLVIFCYLDSHGLTSNFTNTNLDSYVYTKESLGDAKRVLGEGGVCAIGFSSPYPFIYSRLQGLMEDVFGSPPVRVGEDLFLSSKEDPKTFRDRVLKELGGNVRPLESRPRPPLTTDDWPFFYLESASVPMVFRAVLLSIALLSALGVRVGVGRMKRIDLHFFFLGAAFMLVETWAISRASLVYGATWYVSSAVIASLLVAVLLANALVESRGPVRLAPTFTALLLGLLAATLLDPSRLLGLPRAAQLLLAAPLYAIPFLFASLVFASSFQRVKDPADALASNLLGSVLGGALECLSFATGLRSLGFVALGLYGLAWLAARRRA